MKERRSSPKETGFSNQGINKDKPVYSPEVVEGAISEYIGILRQSHVHEEDIQVMSGRVRSNPGDIVELVRLIKPSNKLNQT